MVADMAKIAPKLDRRTVPELAMARRNVVLDVPPGAVVIRRREKIALENRHGAIDRAFAPAWNARQGVLGSTAKCLPVCRR